MRRSVSVALFWMLLMMAACKDASDAPAVATSASGAKPLASGEEDISPAIAVTTPLPRYVLSKLSDKQVGKLLTKAGWTPTFVGKSPPASGASTLRVAAVQKETGQQREAVVFVRCKQGDRSAAAQPGEAYFRDGDCQLSVAVRLGIRNKSEESRILLEKLLAATAD